MEDVGHESHRSSWLPDNVTPKQVRQQSRAPGVGRGWRSLSPTIILAIGGVTVLFLPLVLLEYVK